MNKPPPTERVATRLLRIQCTNGKVYDALPEADAHDLAKELEQAQRLLKSVHEWFMEKAPRGYNNGCGLWIDVDAYLKGCEQKGDD